MNLFEKFKLLSKEEVEELFVGVKTITEMKKKFHTGAGDTKEILAHLEYLGIDYSILLENRHERIVKLGREAGIAIHRRHVEWLRENQHRIFCKDSIYTSVKARVTIHKYNHLFGWLKPACYECGLTTHWRGKPISLEIDHRNGVDRDNRLENLRFLCPNCHSQTETYRGKNYGKKRGSSGLENSPSSRKVRHGFKRDPENPTTKRNVVRYRETHRGEDKKTY